MRGVTNENNSVIKIKTPRTKSTRLSLNASSLDQSRCPTGWTIADEQCVQLQFGPMKATEAAIECRRLGGELVFDNIHTNEKGEDQQLDNNDALVEDLSVLIEVTNERKF